MIDTNLRRNRRGLDDNVRLVMGDHEEAHTYQYQKFGLFFLIYWVLCGGPHNSNHFERQADKYALNKTRDKK